MINWKPGDDIGIRLRSASDEAGADEVEVMLKQINECAHQCGYKIDMSGVWEGVRKSAIDEQAFLDKLHEGRQNSETNNTDL